MVIRTLRIVLTALLVAAPLTAQQTFSFNSAGPYRQSVPRPGDILGYEAGDRHTQYLQQQMVLEQMVVAAGDRVRTETIGMSEEGRTMRMLLISSPANLARLDEIRSNVARLADPMTTPAGAVEGIIAGTPAVVMLSYSVHGYEAAGFEAVMWVAYELLASENPAIMSMLDSTLVILNPSANPDGHERLAVWYNSLPMTRADEPWALGQGQSGQPWAISARFNHYRFDMNRDLIAQSQAPTRAIVRAIMRWNPQVFVDLHSTTSQYFFPPPAAPVHLNYPAQTLRWMDVFGRGNAETFDRYGWQYYVREIFDLYYPGYYDSWPSLNGATGMTYETDGGPQLAIRKEDGAVVTFREGIARHYAASLATVHTAAVNRSARLRDFYDFRRSAIEEARTNPMKRVVILPDNDPTAAAALASLLLRQGIRITRLDRPYTAVAGPYLYPEQTAERRTFPAGALVVDMEQSQSRLARTLLERDPALDSSFVRRQFEKFERNRRRGDGAEGEGYEFYDVTAWSLPLTMGLESFWADDRAALTGTALALGADGYSVPELAMRGGTEARAVTAYLFRNDRQDAARLAMALLRDGFVLGLSGEEMFVGGRAWPRGTFIARTARNPATLHERIDELAREASVEVAAINTAFPDSGTASVGSESVRLARQPRVVVLAGDGVSQTSFGSLWHWMETELRHPFAAVEPSSIGGMATLNDYNVMIIPDGSAFAIRDALGSRGTARLQAWVRDGGVVIAFGSAARLLSHEDVGLSSIEAVGSDEDEESDSLPSGPELTPPLASPSAGDNGPEYFPGAIFRAQLDMSHWLTLGYSVPVLPVLVTGGSMIKPSEDGASPASFVGDSLRLSGFVWPGNTEEHLKESVWASVESQGRGSVVVFAEDPLFRAFWRGPARLVTNAMLLGSGR